ncbi:putative C6 transcription factor [Nemania diffusa]|nr:putative C6 transcription factor [Nemania diffusa]
MTGKQFVPIQPKPIVPGGNDQEPHPQPSRPRRNRPAIIVACDACRRLKTKCDGERPACRRCQSKGQLCSYELPQDTLSRSSARKEITSQLQRENLELRQLFHDLSKRPESEAYTIFQRLRAADDPIALAHSIRQAELLLPRVASEEPGESATVKQLELDAWSRSPVKIPAKPWTTVAGDGIVSELISAWFKWDNSFLYPFIDRECFIQDVREGDPTRAKYCSPFLVNAICALRSYFSDTVDIVRRVSNQDMRVQFLTEAKKHYDHKVPTLPTIQGLWVMFAISYMKGEDRNGSLYRLASYGMLKRSEISRAISSVTDGGPEDASEKRAISKTIWGLFCLESLTAANFRNADVLRPPKIPCPFPEFHNENPADVDLFGQDFNKLSERPPFIPGVINTFCRVAVLISEVLTLGEKQRDNEDTGIGDQAVLRRRSEILAEVKAMSSSLPPALHYEHNFTPETCFLGIVMNTVVYAILRPLHPDVVLDGGGGSGGAPPTTVKTTILRHCALDVELMERYFATWATGEFSTMAFVGPLNAGTVLLPLLPDERAAHLLPRVCRLMRTVAARMPVAEYVMKGWQAALWARKLEIPGPARPYFQDPRGQGAGGAREQLEDVPSNLVVAHVPSDEEDISREWDDGELGFLLQKWSAMTI